MISLQNNICYIFGNHIIVYGVENIYNEQIKTAFMLTITHDVLLPTFFCDTDIEILNDNCY